MNGVQVDTAASAEDLAKKIKETTDANRSFLSLVLDVSTAQERYNEGVAAADAALAAHKITTKEHAATIAELSAEYDKAAKQIVADLVLIKMTADGAFADQEVNAYLGALVNMGLITEDAAKAAKGYMTQATLLETQLKRTGGQANIAAGGLDNARDAIRESAQEATNASGPVHTLAMGFKPLPADGTEWNYDIFITTHGAVPAPSQPWHELRAGIGTVKQCRG